MALTKTQKEAKQKRAAAKKASVVAKKASPKPAIDEEEDSKSSSSNHSIAKADVEEEETIFETEQEELETYRSLNFPAGLLRVLRDARNADFQDVRN